MSTLRSHEFSIITSATPRALWVVLTGTGRPAPHLFGMTVESDWYPGSTIVIGVGGRWQLSGDVLRAEPPRRLSYTLGDRPGDPSVYVTWELRVDGSGTVVRLYVDETDVRTTSEDLEDAWLPVLSLLLAQLERRGSLTEKSANRKEKRCP